MRGGDQLASRAVEFNAVTLKLLGEDDGARIQFKNNYNLMTEELFNIQKDSMQ